jgi:protein phosphatase
MLSTSLLEQVCVEPALNNSRVADPIDAAALSKSLTVALEQANAHVRRIVQANKWSKAGSTVVVALVQGNTAVIANLGDSPLFHFAAATGRFTKVTEDHTVAGVLVRAGRITPEMARVHEGRSQLEFYCGIDKLPREMPLHTLELATGDFLVLCSDGISGHLLDEQLGTIVRDGTDDLEHTASALFKAALDMGETDNQTLILWQHGALQLGAVDTVPRTDVTPADTATLTEAAPVPTVPLDDAAPATTTEPGEKAVVDAAEVSTTDTRVDRSEA